MAHSTTLAPDDLALFAQVVDAGSFTAAATRLGCPKSTVSRRLSALEARLGERLLQRTTRRLSLTELGTAVLEHARQVVAETDSVLALAQSRQARPSGLLRVSMPADIALLALHQALADFVQAHPAITLELDLSPRKVDLLAENYDLALRMGPLPDDASLSARRLASFTGGLYASPGWVQAHGLPSHPQDLTDPARRTPVQALALGRPGAPPPRWRLCRGAPAGGAATDAASPAATPAATQATALTATPDEATWEGLPAHRVLANSPVMLVSLAQAGLGVALLTDLVVRDAVQAGTLLRLLPDWHHAPVPAWAVFPERRLMPAKTRALIEVLDLAMAPCREPGAAGA